MLRKAAARTKDALWTVIGSLLDAFTPEECVNYLANCGYDLVSVENARGVAGGYRPSPLILAFPG